MCESCGAKSTKPIDERAKRKQGLNKYRGLTRNSLFDSLHSQSEIARYTAILREDIEDV